MNELINLLLSLLAGMSLGAVFFGGLWWTVSKGLSSTKPALWFSISFLLRTGAVLAGVYFVGRGRWENMVACLLGFSLARLVILRITGAQTKPRASLNAEACDAP